VDLFDWFNTISIDEIHQLVADGREEDLHLDFKLVNDPDLKNRDDRRNFAKAVSGFANSDGGLIVWGVDCRKNSDGVDCASNAPGVKNLSKFHSRLMEFTASAANPSVSGVEHRKLPDSSDGDHGFVVTYIPASDGGPHMAKLGEDRYYRRSGASFLKMEHFEIADMFGRRPHPKLAISYKIAKWGLGRPDSCRISLFLENHGKGSAQAPYLMISLPQPMGFDDLGMDWTANHGLPRPLSTIAKSFRFGASRAAAPLHPGVSLRVASLYPQNASGLCIVYEIGCADLPLRTGTLSIPASELQLPQ
jgi:hypothetical protein